MHSQPIPTICLNTFKGGVSKTTTSFNLAWYMSQTREIRTMVVDLDPQCNLSQMFLDKESDDIKSAVFRQEYPGQPEPMTSVGEALGEISNNRKLEVEVRTYQHQLNQNLFLLSGSLSVTDYEETLATAESIHQNYTRDIPGALNYVIQKCASECGAEVVIIDTSPSMGCLNMVVVMSSTYFAIPSQADYFSLQALISVRRRITEVSVGGKGTWLDRMAFLRGYTQSSAYPLPNRNPKFLGVLTQMFTVKRGKVTKHFKHYIDKIQAEVANNLVNGLEQHSMTLPLEAYANLKVESAYVLARVQNFNRCAPMAQEQGLPLIALLEDDKRFIDLQEDKVKPMTGSHLADAKKSVMRMVLPIKAVGKWLVEDILELRGECARQLTLPL
jgi:cellulose biosynthesis protein BcsQ